MCFRITLPPVDPTTFPCRWSYDSAQADWFIPRLHPFAQDVGSVIPEGFDAYCRIFHPAWRSTRTKREKVRWSEVAAQTGRTVHPTMQFEFIRVPLAGQPGFTARELQEPYEGRMPSDELAVLTGHLRDATTAPESCWFCIWEGYGQLHGGTVYLTGEAPGRPIRFDGTHVRIGPWTMSIPYVTERLVSERHRHTLNEWRRAATNAPPEYGNGARVEIPGRRYHLYTGTVDEAIVVDPGTNHPLMANMWWPEDRAWFVATEIDFTSTLVGASKQVVDSILLDDRLEALPIAVTDQVTIDADTINASAVGDSI